MEETPLKSPRPPQTDSIQELARFWDSHDLTGFEDELEEVSGTFFEREARITIHLPKSEADTVRELAKSRGIGEEELIHQWVTERIASD